jgi:hypothetical protein
MLLVGRFVVTDVVVNRGLHVPRTFSLQLPNLAGYPRQIPSMMPATTTKSKHSKIDDP